MAYSHLIFPSIWLIMPRTTQFTPFTTRLEIRSMKLEGSRDQSAVMPSSLRTQRSSAKACQMS